jgi:hypothetical protein
MEGGERGREEERDKNSFVALFESVLQNSQSLCFIMNSGQWPYYSFLLMLQQTAKSFGTYSRSLLLASKESGGSRAPLPPKALKISCLVQLPATHGIPWLRATLILLLSSHGLLSCVSQISLSLLRRSVKIHSKSRLICQGP